MFEVALAILSLVSGCFAISVVPFIRKDFGERYLGWLNLFFGYTVVANFTFLGSIDRDAHPVSGGDSSS